MGNDKQSKLPECFRQHGSTDSNSYCTAWGLDRYSYQQGENAKFGFQIVEQQEPALVAKGGGGSLLLYQKEISALCATDYKWVQTQQVTENKLIICKR